MAFCILSTDIKRASFSDINRIVYWKTPQICAAYVRAKPAYAGATSPLSKATKKDVMKLIRTGKQKKTVLTSFTGEEENKILSNLI